MLMSDDLRLPRRGIEPRPSGFRDIGSTSRPSPLPKWVSSSWNDFIPWCSHNGDDKPPEFVIWIWKLVYISEKQTLNWVLINSDYILKIGWAKNMPSVCLDHFLDYKKIWKCFGCWRVEGARQERTEICWHIFTLETSSKSSPDQVPHVGIWKLCLWRDYRGILPSDLQLTHEYPAFCKREKTI